MRQFYNTVFTENEIDNAVTEALFKDKRGGGKNPYVIGTLLKNDDDSFIVGHYGANQTLHRICIEHAPNEYIDYRVFSEYNETVSIQLSQLTRECPFGRIKRIGMCPLVSITNENQPTAVVISDTNISGPQRYFMVPQEKFVQLCPEPDNSSRVVFCENSDLLGRTNFYTSIVTFENFQTSVPVVLYIVYELHDRFFEGNNWFQDGSKLVFEQRFYAVGHLFGISFDRIGLSTSTHVRLSVKNDFEMLLYDNDFPDVSPYYFNDDGRRVSVCLSREDMTEFLGYEIDITYGTRVRCELSDVNTLVSPLRIEASSYAYLQN